MQGKKQNINMKINIECVRKKEMYFSERELMFMFAICRRPSVCLSVCRL